MPRADLGWALIRLVAGFSLAWFHGYAKVFEGGATRMVGKVAELGFPQPTVFAWAAALSEFAGGILIAIGLATRPAGAFVGFTMLVALYNHRADPIDRWELAGLYFAIAIGAVLMGGGRYALDRSIRLRMPVASKHD